MAGNERGLAWLVGRPWFWIVAISILFLQPLVRTFLRERPQLPPVGAAAPSFELTRETGAPLRSEDLAGKVWVAAFGDESALAPIQKRLRHMGDSYRLITFALDGGDLAARARAVHANPRSWFFVTGDRAVLERVAAPFPHDRVTLIDQSGRMRGDYDLADRSEADALVATLGLLANSY
jgi:hypothetical protein